MHELSIVVLGEDLTDFNDMLDLVKHVQNKRFVLELFLEDLRGQLVVPSTLEGNLFELSEAIELSV